MKKRILPGIISGITFITAFILYIYTDLTSLTVWTLNIWDNLAYGGGIRNFYAYSAQNLYHLDHAMVGSDILIYIPWAIWNLPIWVAQHFFGIDAAYHAIPQLWSKLFLLAVFALCIIPVKRLVKDKDELSRVIFLSCTSFFTITSLAYTGQNDVVVIFPFLMALADLTEGKKWSFILWSAVSIAFKPFFVFSFIAIVLLKEKNLLKILGYIAAGFSIYVLQKIPFMGAYLYKESLSYGPTAGGLKLLFASCLDIPPAGASLFVLALGLIYLGVYFYDVEKDEINAQELIYASTAPMIIFFMFTRYEAYRVFYLVPLVYILMSSKPRFARTHLLLEMASTTSLILFYLLDDVLFYSPNYFFIRKEWVNFPSISEVLTSKLPGFGYTAFTAVFVLSMSLILVINHPRFSSHNRVLCREEEPWLMTVRSLIYAVPLVASIAIRVFM